MPSVRDSDNPPDYMRVFHQYSTISRTRRIPILARNISGAPLMGPTITYVAQQWVLLARRIQEVYSKAILFPGRSFPMLASYSTPCFVERR